MASDGSTKKQVGGSMQAAVRAIFSCINHHAPLPDGIDLKILVVPKDIALKLSPPPFEYKDGFYVLLRPNVTIPPALASKVVTRGDLLTQYPPTWGLSGPQYSGEAIKFQQRYCTPRGRTEYCTRTKGTIWTEVDGGEENVDCRVLYVYQSQAKRVIRFGRGTSPVLETAAPKQTKPAPAPAPPKVNNSLPKSYPPIPVPYVKMPPAYVKVPPESILAVEAPKEAPKAPVPVKKQKIKPNPTGNKSDTNSDSSTGKTRQTSKNWSIEEDEKLAKLVRNAPDVTRIAWNVLAYQMPNRTGKQCRERYYNKLRPDRKKGCWTEKEDDHIVRLQATLGNQWSKIAAALHGRTDNDVKNRWHSMERSRKRKVHDANMWGQIQYEGTKYQQSDESEPARKKPTLAKDAAPPQACVKSSTGNEAADLKDVGQHTQVTSPDQLPQDTTKVAPQLDKTRQDPPSYAAVASAKKDKLTGEEFTLCHGLLNLHSTLKKPDEPGSMPNNQPSDASAPLHDDYLFEHILMKNQEATRSPKVPKLLSSNGHKTGATKSTSTKKSAARQNKKAKIPDRVSSKDQSSFKKSHNGEDIDDIDKYSALARSALKKSPAISPSPESSFHSAESNIKRAVASLIYKGGKWPMRGIKTPGDHDCLTGRGGGTNHHPGNINYRNMVEEHKDAYAKCSRTDKAVMSMKIVKDWRALEPPGRFLKLNARTGLWDDIGDKDARVKCAQGLREKKWVIRMDKNPDPENLIAGYNKHQQNDE